MDHHPEWAIVDQGRTVNVRLTTHFAGNVVTILDYQLAEACNEAEQTTLASWQMHPRFSEGQILSLKIGLGVLALGLFGFRYFMSKNTPLYDIIQVRARAEQRPVTSGFSVLESKADAIADEQIKQWAEFQVFSRPTVL